MRDMNKIYTVLGVCVLVAVFAGFYTLRLASTTSGVVPPAEPVPQDMLTQEFHDKNVSPSDYAAQVNAREMTDALPYPHELTVEALRVRAAAEGGDARSQGKLGEMYHNGEGMERDLRKAFYWFRLGARNDDLASRLYLGRYYMGELPELGIDKDLDKAEDLLRPAAAGGDVQAMALLGRVLQEKVRAGEKDREQEATWWYNRGTGGEWDETYTPPDRQETRETQADPQDGGQVETGNGEDKDAVQQYP